MSVVCLDFPGHWITDQGEAHVVVGQVNPATAQIRQTGASRPLVLQTLTELLGPLQRLAQIVSAGRPCILVLPELALGLDDWPALDQLVRAWPHPLIVICGFGVTAGARLKAWLAESGPTVRHAAWAAGAEPADARVYNGGWCWVHVPGTTNCVAFLKVTAEQRTEILVPGIDQGTQNLCIRLNDLIVFPTICSDLLSEDGGHKVIQRKISRYLEDEVNDGRRVLLVGLLLQPFAHEAWRTAIVDAARSINNARVNVCLANCANAAMLSIVEDVDKWRNLSGVYVAKGRNARLAHFSAVRRFTTEQIDAAVVRMTTPAVLGGPVRWTFETATGRHLWAVQMAFGVAANGSLIDPPCTDQFAFETRRVLNRITRASDAPEECKTANVQQSLGRVSAQIETGTSPSAEVICQKVLFGDPRDATALSADTLSDYLHEGMLGLRMLGAIASVPAAIWQTDSEILGQLQLADVRAKVLVWCFPGPSIRMRNSLSRWGSDFVTDAPLLVFCKATGRTFPTPDRSSDRRRDVSQAPSASRKGIDEPDLKASVIECNLDVLEECFEAATTEGFISAVQRQIGACLQKPAAR